MRWAALLRALPLFLILACCASPRRAGGPAGAFTEVRPAPDVFEIFYPQDGYTHSERTHDLALLRVSELALQNGFSHLTVLEEEGPSAKRRAAAPAFPKANAGLAVRGYWTKPNGFFTFDTAFLIGALRKKYGIQPAAAQDAAVAKPDLGAMRRLFAGLRNGQRLRLATPHAPSNECILMGYYPADDTVAVMPAGGARFSGRIYPLRDILSVELMAPGPQDP
jgi:hypothetical protein